MKKAIFAAILVAFAFIAVFGGWDFVISGEKDMSSCIATSLNGFQCSSQPGTLGFLNYHLKAFTDFSSGALGAAFSVLVLVALAFASLAFEGLTELFVLPAAASLRLDSSGYVPIQRRKSSDWISLLENSPSL